MDEIFFQLDVSDNGHVWGVNKNQDIYRWTGKNWQHIGGKDTGCVHKPEYEKLFFLNLEKICIN